MGRLAENSELNINEDGRRGKRVPALEKYL
jgi:hypothetical protein